MFIRGVAHDVDIPITMIQSYFNVQSSFWRFYMLDFLWNEYFIAE